MCHSAFFSLSIISDLNKGFMDFLNDYMHTMRPGSQALLGNPLSPGQEQTSGLCFSSHVCKTQLRGCISYFPAAVREWDD